VGHEPIVLTGRRAAIEAIEWRLLERPGACRDL
jgi:hypothetical protein